MSLPVLAALKGEQCRKRAVYCKVATNFPKVRILTLKQGQVTLSTVAGRGVERFNTTKRLHLSCKTCNCS